MNCWNIWLGFSLWVKPAALSFLPPLCILRLLGGGPESSTRGGVCLRNSAKETNCSQRALNLGRWENAEHCNWPNVAPMRDAISLGLQSSGRNFNFSHPTDDRQIFLTSAVTCSPPKCFLKPVKHSLEMPTSSSLRMEKQAWWHQQLRTMGCRFHRKDSLLDSAGPCFLSQAVSPVVTQEGMPLTSRGHARELLSTCQQVTSYDNQMRANLRVLCVTAYLDLELSFQGLSFMSSWAHSQGPSCVPCLCLQAQRAVPPRVRAWLSPRGNAQPCQDQLSLVCHTPHSGRHRFSIYPGSYQSASNVGDEASSFCWEDCWNDLIVIPGDRKSVV